MRGRSCRAFRVFGGLWGLWCLCGLCGLRVGETFEQFRRRMARVQDYMNSDEFRRQPDGAGLPGLARDFLWRCEELQRRQGKRLAF